MKKLFSICAVLSLLSIQVSASDVIVRKDRSDLTLSSIDLDLLGFGDDRSDGASRAKILSFVQRNLDKIIEKDKKATRDISAYFMPVRGSDGGYNITFSDQSASIRFQQALYYINENNKKVYVPLQGAQLVAYINKLEKLPLGRNVNATINGRLVELNSSIVDSSQYEGVLEAFLAKEDQLNIESSVADRAAFLAALNKVELRMIGNVLLERDVFTIDETTLSKILLEDSELITKFLKYTKDKGRLIFNRQNKNSSYKLVWRVVDPFKSSLVIDIHLNAEKGQIVQNVHSLAKHATVNIYRGTSFNIKRSLRRSGDSSKMQNASVDDGLFKQEDYDLALINISKVVEYFKHTFNWNSFDNKGSDLDATVRYKGSRLFGTAFLRQNAAWVGEPYNQFIFGRGGSEIGDFLNAFDVIGHEYCHAIISHSSNLSGGNETGALNEHICDILGVGLESSVEAKAYDFAIGEKVVLESNKALRDFLNPEKSFSAQATDMSDVMKRFGPNCKVSQENDECGVHYSNGVLNKVVGRSISDLGWDRMKDLVFEVTTKKLLSNSDFLSYKKQMVGTCRQLDDFSSSECDLIEQHFIDSGVTEQVIGVTSEDSLSGRYNQMICQVLEDSCENFQSGELLNELSEMCRECGH